MARLDDDPFADIGKVDDDPFGDIGALSPAGREVVRQGLDVAKQIPSAVVGTAESALTFPAVATGFVGGLVEKIPGFAPSPEQAERRKQLLELTAGARRPFTQFVPDPETRLGALTRTGLETALSTVAGARNLSVPRAAGVGATAGVTGEVAGQATEGTAAEPYARVGGTLVAGTAAARQAERAAVRAAVPSIAETKTAGGAKYDAFRTSGFGIDPAAGPQFSGVLKADLNARGLTERTVDQTWRVLDHIEKQPFTTPQKFHEAYQELGKVASGATNANERLAANIAQERLLGMLENMPPGFITGGDPRAGALLLQEANQLWAAAMRAQNVSGRITKAEQVASGQYSGLGLENELRRRMGVLGLPPEAAGGRVPSRGFTPEERRAFQQFGEGTTGQNIRRYLTGALSGRGGIGVGALSLGGGGLAGYLGADPVLSGALGAGVPLAGLGLAMRGNRSALARARDLERMLLARSPLAAGRIPREQPTLPLWTLPPTLATIGEGEP